MRYVDTGYAVALGTLFLYALSLFARRRRLGRAAELVSHDRAAGHDRPAGSPGLEQPSATTTASSTARGQAPGGLP